MKIKHRLVLLIGVSFFLAARAGAELYKATVTREAQNLYRVDYSYPRVYVKTKYCYAYCFAEDALIDTTDMEIHFLDSNETCDIDRILIEK